jgi:hypothetical protein
MIHSVALICVLVAAALDLPGLASADQSARPYATITQLDLKFVPSDPCATACADAAARERAKAGPEPAAPLYRFSPTEAAVFRANVIKGIVANEGFAEADVKQVLPAWDQSVVDWQDAEPKGDYRPNDVADVFAKYWIFAWIYGGGADPTKVTAAMMAGVRTQAHRLFAADPTFVRLTEGQRQTLADAIMRRHTQDMQNMDDLADDSLFGGADEQGANELKDKIVRHFEEQFDIDLLKLGLTYDQGFVIETAQ